MSNDNRVSAVLSDKDSAEILKSVQAIRARLPFLVTLSGPERKRLAKMGTKSVGFDEKCVAYMQSNPEFLPGFLPIDEINKDRELRTRVMRFVAELDSLARQVDDTLMVVSSEIWSADLAFYQNVRAAAKRDRAGAKGIFEDLQAQFPRTGKTADKSAAQTPASPSNGARAEPATSQPALN